MRCGWLPRGSTGRSIPSNHDSYTKPRHEVFSAGVFRCRAQLGSMFKQVY